MTRQILVCRPELSDLKKVLKHLNGSSFKWAYLGTSIPAFRLVNDSLGTTGVHFDTTEQFHEAGSALRDSYLKYIYEIGRKLNSLRWWVTSLSYRSRIVSKTFHHICYLKVALDLINDTSISDSLVIVLESSTLKTLKRNIPKEKSNTIHIFGLPRSMFFRPAMDFLNMLAHRFYFLLRESKRIIQTNRAISVLQWPKEPTTLILSWATPENINLGEQFHETYFGNLAYEIENRGHRVGIVPLILRDIEYNQALKSLKNNGYPLIIPHQYIGFLNLVTIAISSCRRPSRPRVIPTFSGMDVSDLVITELRETWISNSFADMSIIVNMVRRWASLKLPISRFIYIYENQPAERALCWEVRRSFPQATLVGYQHAGMPHFLLNYHLAPGGEPTAPLPDRIVTVGDYTAKLLSDNNCGPMDIRTGGVLQVDHIFENAPQSHATIKTQSTPTVLIAPSDGLEEASELAFIAAELFKPDENINVILKCHPRTPFESIRRATGIRLKGHITVSNEPITRLMANSSVMVYSGSTVGVQAIALGVPCVHVRTAFDFDLDPLEGFPQARLEATGISEVRKQVRWLLQNRDSFISEHLSEWQRIVRQMYGPITSDTYTAFIK